MPPDRRPPRFPPPSFPLSRPALFAATPPAVFPVILGLLGLGLALRRACEAMGLPGPLPEVFLGAMVGLWGFAVLAMLVKLLRRPAVLGEDLRPLPGRAGLAAASIGGMAVAGVLQPHAPDLALVVVLAALAVHLGLGLAAVRVLSRDPDNRMINPTWHLNAVGFIVAAPVLADLGYAEPARGIFAVTLLAACGIWLVSLVQILRRVPPAPLRPLLAIHLAPASLLAQTADLTGQGDLAALLTGLAIGIFCTLILAARWLLRSGFTPIWGALTFPLAAFATALLSQAPLAGLTVTVIALAVIPPLAWKILRLWPGGRLAARTNAAIA